jgi:hypothetical protein
MISIDDSFTSSAEFDNIIKETRVRTLQKTKELREKYPEKIFLTDEQIKCLNESELFNYHLKISEIYHETNLEKSEKSRIYEEI